MPIRTTRAFVRLYRAAGGQAELLEFEGLGHGFILFEPERAEALRQTQAVLTFIDAHSGGADR